jgi:predicted metal-dependent peptidase
MSETTETTELSRSLVYLVSARGGDNYWARVINGCDKFYQKNFGTASVSVAPNGRYVLNVDDDFFHELPTGDKKLVLVHEAGHIALRHIERLFRVQCQLADPTLRKAVMVVFNIAADLADNDKIVRNEPEFKDSKFPWILPEKMNYPKGKSMEQYIAMLVADLPQALENMEKMLDQMLEGKDGEKQEQGGSGGAGIEVPIDGGSLGGIMPGKGGKGKKGSKGEAESDQPTLDDPQVPQGLGPAARNNPELIDKLADAFERLTKKAHQLWNKMADNMSPEEATGVSNKMKQHAKRLVKSAHEQTIRSRGTVPAGIESLVKGLLTPEQIPWHWLLDDALQGAIHSKILEEMAMPNTSLFGTDYEPWPGFTLDRKFRIWWLTDTSGSVADAEYARACLCINSLMKVNKFIELVHIQGDAACQHEELTDNLAPPEDGGARARYGYGGTVYTPMFKRILGVDTPQDWQNASRRPEEHPGKPDLIVVFTDGGVVIDGEVFPQYRPECPIVWLVAPNCRPAPGMNNTPPDRVIEMFHIKGEFDEDES